MMFQSILVALLRLGAPNDIAVPLAQGIATYAKTPTEAAFLTAWSKHESEYSADIMRGNCPTYRCDPHRHADGTIEHRARGLFQLHRGAAGKDWDELPGNIDAQVRSAARMTRWALHECKGDVRCAFRVLGALPKTKPLKGEEKRVADFERARRVVQ